MQLSVLFTDKAQNDMKNLDNQLQHEIKSFLSDYICKHFSEKAPDIGNNEKVSVSLYKSYMIRFKVDYEQHHIIVLSVLLRLPNGEIIENPNIASISTKGILSIINTIKEIPILGYVKNDIEEYGRIYNSKSYTKKVRIIKQIMSKILNDYRKGELCNYYDTWISFEVFFYLLGIRDHFIHNFETFLIGCYLLHNVGKDDLLFSWVLTSTFHDIGYPIEHYSDLNQKISGLYRHYNFPSISNQLDKMNVKKEALDDLYILFIPINNEIGTEKRINLRTILTHELSSELFISIENASKILTTFEDNLQHGLVSSCIMMKEILRSKGTEYLLSDSYDDLKKSAIAVLMHHYSPNDDINGQIIRFDYTPLVVLLIICDELQEWNRPLDDFGLDDYRGRLIYRLNEVKHDRINNRHEFSFILSVDNDSNYKQQEIESIINKTIRNKLERFNLINDFGNNTESMIIKLEIKFNNNRIGNIIEKQIF